MNGWSPDTPNEPDSPQPPLTREDIMPALDVLEEMGKDGVIAICYGFPRDSVDRLLNQYSKDVLPWIRAVKEIADATHHSGSESGGGETSTLGQQP